MSFIRKNKYGASHRLVFLQGLEYILHKDVHADLKPLWNANQNANTWDCNFIF